MTPLDRTRMQDALALAQTAIGITEPNPRVGCVVGHEDGRVLGQGATHAPGQAHAEVMALRDAAAAGHQVRGATAWVTLEPCAHFGRTPPCCDALIDAGLARVVVAVADPFPQVAGAGIHRMRAAGMQVDMAAPELAHAAWDLNIGFFSRVLRQRPWVRVKVAASLDGRTALDNGKSQWITGAAARADGHCWRHRASAILTGVGTVLADNPRLDVRGMPGSAWQPLRVVVDSTLRTPLDARLLDRPGQVLIATALREGDNDHRAAHAAATLRQRGVEVCKIHSQAQAAVQDAGRVDLGALLQFLSARGVGELHVEAGPTLTGALAKGGWVDEWLVYLAPKLLGGGHGIVHWPPLTALDGAMELSHLETLFLAPDLRLRFAPAGPARLPIPDLPGSPGSTP